MSYDKKKIKPCPFCGSDNLGLDIVTTTTSSEEQVYKISCMKCPAAMQSNYGFDIIEAWNKRV